MRTGIDFLLKSITGKDNTIIYDESGLPSVMTRIPRFNISDVIRGGPDTPHPMFIINGEVKDEIYVGKYLASVFNNKAYSLPGKIPHNTASMNDAMQMCYGKGPGWHMMSNAEWAGIALWSKMNGTLPRGNDYNGRSNRKTFERGVMVKKTNYNPGQNVIGNSDHYPGEQIRFDYTGDIQSCDLSGIKKFKIDSYCPGNVAGTSNGGLYSSIIDKPTDVNKLNMNVIRRKDKICSDPILVMNTGACTYNNTLSESPCIIKESDTSYKMWFGGNDGTSTRLLYSTSTDGKVWTAPILIMDKGTCSYNSYGSYTPNVIKESDTSYKMWFTGHDGSHNRILYSTSTDGKVWSTPILVVDINVSIYTSGHVHIPHVIKESDTSYKMWFSGNDYTNIRILYSTSTDGKVWSTPILVMDKGTCSYNSLQSHMPYVIKESDTSYKMWFTGSDGTTLRILYSTSTDGKVWSTPILFMDKGTCIYNGTCSDYKYIIKESDTSYKMWFSGSDGTNKRILYTEFKSLDIENSLTFDDGEKINDRNCLLVMGTQLTKYDFTHEYPYIIKESDTSYKMWFSGHDGTNTRLLYSTSTDGKVWSTPILVMDKGICSYNSSHSYSQSIIKESDTSYKMWFSGYDGTNQRILYSTSTDGKVWSTPILVIDKGTCSYNTIGSHSPYIIKESDTSYKMWFSGHDGTNTRLLYSTSTDGKVWSIPILVMDKGTCSYNSSHSYSQSIIKESDTSYKMWFGGHDGTYYRILYSTSTDGKVWSAPILVMDKGTCSYNGLSSYSPFIIKESDTSYRMWFTCSDGTIGRISYSTSTDGVNWDINDGFKPSKKSYIDKVNNGNGYVILTVLETEKAKKYIAGEKIRFNFTGEPIKLNTSNITKVRFECYGATGASYGSTIGGKGGYVTGDLNLITPKDLYLYIGARGGYGNGLYGYNGGGISKSTTDPNGYPYHGAGATDIRTKLDDLYSRFIVAGGGGNAEKGGGNTGIGGGWTGGPGTGSYPGTGGSQSAGGTSVNSGISIVNGNLNGSFGVGSILTWTYTTCDSLDVGPGAGGWYGGGASIEGGAGGGSSYAAGNVNCPTIHPEGITLDNTNTTAGANTLMDGYIVMTVLETTDTKKYNVGDKVRFDYTGSSQTFQQGNATKVKVECYGASGGCNHTQSKGGYAFGEVLLTKINNLSIIVGGKGENGSKGLIGKGGYNGGGDGGKPFDSEHFGGSGGGGATDIRTELTDDLFDELSLESRLVVAGGGGGESNTSIPGDGGGWSGISATPLSINGASMPASQTKGNALGKGGNGDDAINGATNSAEGCGGAGGGYYGGFGGTKLNMGRDSDTSGSGGSSYVSGDTNCPSKQIESIILTNSGSIASSNNGDGYAIITILEVGSDRKYTSGEKFTFNYIGAAQNFNTKNAKRIRVECFGPEGPSIETALGGKGGYTSGEMILSTPLDLYLYAGGIGGYSDDSSMGFNGGGHVTITNDSKIYYGSGATDVRTVVGDLSSRLMVAGGGGAGEVDGDYNTNTYKYINGRDGGNFIEPDIYSSNNLLSITKTTQTSGGVLQQTASGGYNSGTGENTAILGRGTNYIFTVGGSTFKKSYWCSPGAGGWYGGISANCSFGQGGTSYIAGDINCPTAHPNNLAFINTVCKPGINEGNGRIIITILETEEDYKYKIGDKLQYGFASNMQTFNTKNAKRMKIECIASKDITDNNKAFGELMLNGYNKDMYLYTGSSAFNNNISEVRINQDEPLHDILRIGAVKSNAMNTCNKNSVLVAGHRHSAGLKSDGTVVAVGDNTYGQCNVSGWDNIVAVYAGYYQTIGLKSDGTVVAVGSNNYGECNVVSGWKDIVAVSARFNNTVGLKSDGTVVAAGDNTYGQCNISGWTNIVAITVGIYHILGLKSDGTVVAVGLNDYNQCNLSRWVLALPKSNKRNCNKTISVCKYKNSFAIKSDGTVVAAGDNTYGQCNVSGWTDIVDISSNGYTVMGLKSDGTVVKAGGDGNQNYSVSNWTNIVKISVGDTCALGLKSDGTVIDAIASGYITIGDVSSWTDIVDISVGNSFVIGLKSDGTVVAVGSNNSGQCNVSGWKDIVDISISGYTTIGLKSDGTVLVSGTTSAGTMGLPTLVNVSSISFSDNLTGRYNLLCLKSDGTVVAVGDNNCGQCDVSGWTNIAQPGTLSTQSTSSSNYYIAGNSNCLTAHPDRIIMGNSGASKITNTGNGFIIITILETDDIGFGGDLNLTYTGTGPVSWTHNNSSDGIYDLVGNLWNMTPGLRINGNTLEPQIIKDNDIAQRNYDITKDSNWKAIDIAGQLVALGSGVKYTNTMNAEVTLNFKALTLTTASYYAKSLGIIPIDTSDHELANYIITNTGGKTIMDALYRGGGVGDATTLNSIFSALFKKNLNEDISTNKGFRICYYKA